MATNNSKRNMSIYNMIALCHINDGYLEFNENLSQFKKGKSFRDDYYDLYRLSKGESIVGGKKIKSFYQDNKEIIDTINKYSSVYYYLIFNYNENGQLIDNSNIDYFYKYLLEHASDKDNIVSLLSKIKDLGFNKFSFDESIDFTEENYKAHMNFKDNNRFRYLDNMEALSNYDEDIVEYRTTDSNYLIDVKRFEDEISKYDKNIVLNSLLFSSDRLPKTISKESIFDEIVKLKDKQIDNCTAIQNSVDLSISIDDFYTHFYNAMNVADSFKSYKDKEKIKGILSKIRRNLDELKEISTSYDEKITKNNENITKDQLIREKTRNLERRYWSDLDTD